MSSGKKEKRKVSGRVITATGVITFLILLGLAKSSLMSPIEEEIVV